jgi:hypothetical protein
MSLAPHIHWTLAGKIPATRTMLRQLQRGRPIRGGVTCSRARFNASAGKVQWRGNLRRRARTGRQARFPRQLDSVHRAPRFTAFAAVVLGSRYFTGDQFEVWGWRIPFLLSIVLLGISTWIRLSLHESPAFLKMKEEGKCCKAPIRESFGKWESLKVVLIALFSINAGQAVTFYAAQFYVLFFLTQFLKMDPALANTLLIVSVVIGAPFFIFFGWLSDRVG